jgi:hypothetical protein
MPRLKKKPDFTVEDLGVNPFVDGLTIFVTKKTHKVLNKYLVEDVKEFDLETVPYTKVFEVGGDRKQVSELPIRSKELYLFLIHTVKSAQDYVWIDRDAYMKIMGISSVNTYKVAVRGLSDGLYIYPHYKLRDVYWINPHFFFKGSRINKYPKNVVVKAKIESK